MQHGEEGDCRNAEGERGNQKFCFERGRSFALSLALEGGRNFASVRKYSGWRKGKRPGG